MKKRLSLLILIFFFGATFAEQTSFLTRRVRNANQAVDVLKQKIRCLIFGEPCTSFDQAAIHYSLGFMVGTVPFEHLFNVSNLVVQRYGSASPVPLDTRLKRVMASVLIDTLAYAMNLRGEALRPLSSAIGDIVQTVVIPIADIAHSNNQTLNPFTLTKSVARYIRMNLGCIWSESACQGDNPQQRRKALYFWIGFISAYVARKALPYVARIKGWHPSDTSGGHRLGGSSSRRSRLVPTL